ncbi:MAG: polyprenol monophosphomannose synthase [Actinomycetota bacterium]|nr:polyprenol monophosphomannose synthase [Actinomycetota bacterium]
MKTVIVIPTYNEADNIVALLNEVLLAEPDADVLVVDDNSPDGTGRLVRNHPRFMDSVHLLRRAEKEGLGAAYRAGFAWALMRGYTEVVQMDADFSHPPAMIPELVSALDFSDVSIGSRYVDGGEVVNWSWSRKLISRGGNLYVRLVLGIGVHDATAGFRAFRADALAKLGALDSSSNGYCFQVENAWRACRLGMRVTEVPITFTDRTAGRSKMTGLIVREALRRILIWRWQEISHAGNAPRESLADVAA